MTNSTRQQVRHLMFLDQRFRDSDKELWLAIAEASGLVFTRAQKMIYMGVPTEEVVARRRRELSKEFPASPKVLLHRHKSEARWVEEYSKQSWLRKIFKKRGIIEEPREVSER